MPNTKFDAKSFNAEAFKYKVGTVPNLKMNEIKKSAAIAANPDIKSVFANQDGTGYARIAMRGLLDGDAVNYDGQTDITATSLKTFEQGVVVVGRAKAWVERDFSYDITGGQDFMDAVAAQIAEYKDRYTNDNAVHHHNHSADRYMRIPLLHKERNNIRTAGCGTPQEKQRICCKAHHRG